MYKSDTIGALAAALCKAQSEIKAAEMNSSNPFLKSKYADLGSVIEAARPALGKNGLAFTQLVGGDVNNITLDTLLMHSSGEYIGQTVSLPAGEEKGRSLAQSAGAIITYLRRYGLSAILGVYADEDTDAKPPVAKPDGKPATKPVQQIPVAEITDNDPPSDKAWHAWDFMVQKAQNAGIEVMEPAEDVTTGQLRQLYTELKKQIEAQP